MRRSDRIAAQAIAGMDEQQLRQYFRFPENNNCVRLKQEHLGVCKTNPEGHPFDPITYDKIDINKPNFLLEDLSCISEETYRRLPLKGIDHKENPITRSIIYCEEPYPPHAKFWDADDITSAMVTNLIKAMIMHRVQQKPFVEFFSPKPGETQLTDDLNQLISELYTYSNTYYYLSLENGDHPSDMVSFKDLTDWIRSTYNATIYASTIDNTIDNYPSSSTIDPGSPSPGYLYKWTLVREFEYDEYPHYYDIYEYL